MTYTLLSHDTSIEAERRHLTALQVVSKSQRAEMASSCTRSAQRFTLSGLKRRESSLEVIKQKFSNALLGFRPDCLIVGTPDMWAMSDPFELARELHLLFEQLRVKYFVTGGVAASCHGEPRTTLDLDLVVAINREDTDILGASLTEFGFYVPQTNLENVMAGIEQSLCVTHQAKCIKADITVSSSTPFDQIKMERRELIDEAFYVCSAEDTILQKLKWGARSHSEKQWRDVQSILRIQEDSLDFEYISQWAKVIDVTVQWANALRDAGMGDDP